jgi:hypothetical protein
LWNELNCFPEWYKLVPEIVTWHREMIKELRRLDPHGRPISTSFCNPYGHEEIWNVPEIDFVQSHTYGSKEMGREQTQVPDRGISAQPQKGCQVLPPPCGKGAMHRLKPAGAEQVKGDINFLRGLAKD